jgi:hypothetical protein
MIEQRRSHAAAHLPGCFGEIELGSLAQILAASSR